jgi:uncharacterized integral membrane protein
MRQLRWVLAIVVLTVAAVLLATFVIGNQNSVTLDLPLLGLKHPPLWLALAGAFFMGAFAASAGLLLQLAKKTLAARRFEKRVAGLESEIHQLRNLPLAESDSLLAPESSAPRARR